MLKLSLAVPLFALVCALSAPASTIAINNASFEADVQTGTGPTSFTFDDVPGWSFANNAYVFTWAPSVGPGGEFPGGIPNGANVVWVGGPNVVGPYSATLSQTLSAKLEANTTYTMTVYVGQRADIPLSGYTISFGAGGVVLASDSSLRPDPGTFLADTITFDSGSHPAELGQSLEINLYGSGVTSSGGGGQVDFDNVSLKATTAGGVVAPEPALLAPLGVLFLGLVMTFANKAFANNPSTPYSGPRSGTFECSGAPVPQNAEYVFKNVPPVKMRLDYDTTIWTAKLLPVDAQNQKLILKNIGRGPQKTCAIHWVAE